MSDLPTFFVVYHRATEEPAMNRAYRAKAPATRALVNMFLRDGQDRTREEALAHVKATYDIREMRLVPVATP